MENREIERKWLVGEMPEDLDSFPYSEIEQAYLNSNTLSGVDQKTVADYLQLYVTYKLKVKAALDAHLEETEAFKQACQQCMVGERTMPQPVMMNRVTRTALLPGTRR